MKDKVNELTYSLINIMNQLDDMSKEYKNTNVNIQEIEISSYLIAKAITQLKQWEL